MNKSKWAFDIEIFINLFLISFLNIDNPEEIKSFIISWDLKIDDKEKLKEFLDNNVVALIGYNNLYFDAPILSLVLEYNGININKDVFEYSQKIIATERGEARSYRKNYPWPQIDLMKMMAFDKLGVSLKQCAINLKWKKIQDFPLPYDHVIERKDIEIVLKYNINDVLIVNELYKVLQPQIKLREELGKIYDVDLLSASDSKIANILLEKIYTDETGIDIKELKYLRTKRDFLWLRDCICPNIKFKTRKLQDLKFETGNTLVVSENNFAYKKNLEFGNCEYVLGVGGLHSEDQPGKFVTDKNYIIMDADVSSYYPYIILNNKIKPEHLNDDFLDILKKITEERIEAKKSGDKIKADGLKITVNSIFGKLNSETFWLQDAKAFLSVTVSGQLYLLMLIESLVLNGILVISANTDGVVCKVPKNLLDKYYEICNEWKSKTNFELEFTEYEKYIRTDVNNYITKKSGEKTKEKGRYLKEVDLKKGYHYPIVPNCLYEYFVNNRSVDQTLLECDDILDFCISQKSGKDFSIEYRTDRGVEKLQKTNRFYISNSGGNIIKVNDKKGTEIGIYVGENCRIINDYDSSIPISEYDINYGFYKEEALKYINDIENSKFSNELVVEELSEEDDIADIDIDTVDTSKIQIKSPKFGYSKSSYYFDKENSIIYRGIGSIKYVTPSVAKELLDISKNKYNTFVDLLIAIEENSSVNSRQLETLIRLNFFDSFNNNKKLLDIFIEFNKGKNKYGKKLKQETKNKRRELLIEFEKNTPNKKINILEQVFYEQNLLNYIQTTFDLDKRYAYVIKVNEKYSPRLDIHCLANGKQSVIKIQKNIYDNHLPVRGGDIIYCEHFSKKPAVKFVDGNFIEEKNKPCVWWLESYNLLSKEEIDNLIN